MQYLFSPTFKYTTWRQLWVALAYAESRLGLPIDSEQIDALKTQVNNLDFDLAAQYESELHHDVMAHIKAFGDQVPLARGIIHMGATSAFVTDNTDLIQMRRGLVLLKEKLKTLLGHMKSLALKTADIPTLSYTHLQPAQPTTVGKRICVWIQDFLLDLEELTARTEKLRFLGVKGATGTQSSFLSLFDGDSKKVDKLDQLVAKEMGFSQLFTITTQTYTRKQDLQVLSALQGLGATVHKCATDLRLLAHLGEMQEAFGKSQVGSSAMPHKRNPIYAERACGLGRFLMNLSANGADTFATQWLERSLDDSANRRLVLPEAFLTADALLELMIHLFTHLQINEEQIAKNLEEKLFALSKENLLMEAVKKGKDRQRVHERLRLASSSQEVENDSEVGLTSDEINHCLMPNTGLAATQVYTFLKNSF